MRSKLIDIGAIVALLLALAGGLYKLGNSIGNLETRISNLENGTLIKNQKESAMREIEKKMSDTINNIDMRQKNPNVPLGTVLAFYGTQTQLPKGYLFCNGEHFTRSNYPKLYEFVIKVNPELKINDDIAKLPDLRGEFLRGLDAGRNVDPGRKAGSIQTDAFKKHAHPLSQEIGRSNGWCGHNAGKQCDQRAINGPGDRPMEVAGIGDERETRPRNVAVAFIMRAVE